MLIEVFESNRSLYETELTAENVLVQSSSKIPTLNDAHTPRLSRLFMYRVLTMLTTGALSGLPAQEYHLKTEIQIGGDGGWTTIDIDSAARRLYIPLGNKVFVIDTIGTPL